ncbi:receptor-type tyrosine-protein phosphatase eta [Pangasianodon hypophthalmus]|uniref:receptor-type tyrosine-protein phosphatase eta n=1 Tax=Pangasianodon hypophthalmus TaxID=310915 RepID=UPI0023081964|nr:receptor-type tyrosine-protein phosphatase eta [Pangasianodon hypophthalmus]
MSLLGSLLLVAVSVICAERVYFHGPRPATWDNARLYCQACYTDLTTITLANAEVLGLNLTSDYWIGLRQNMSGSKFWSRWANGEPVLYQNWYPGHPVPKKKPEPQPTCPTPPAINNTKTEVMQCPAFAKLCECLNASGGNDEDLIFESTTMFNTTINSTVTGMMWCPTLAKLCACLNSSEDNETSITESTTVFTTVTSPTPTVLVTTSSPTSTTSNDLEPEYIEDSCVALLSFGMWQEKQCNEFLPYICYDERFYGDVNISNVNKTGGMLTWSVAGISISHYRVEINGNFTANVTNVTSYQIKDLAPGRLYRVQIIPVKCSRDLNAQNISFYTLPEEIINLRKVSVETNAIRLSWKASSGTNVSYLVNTEPGDSKRHCCPENCSITSLQPGQRYNFIVKAVVNGTIFGEPGNILACTKPSKVMNLTSSNNASDTITATWDSPDINSLQYSYNITLVNMTKEQDMYMKYERNGSKTTTLSSLIPGTKYKLNVSASVLLPDCFEEGEAASITAYTTPMPVSNLRLDSTANSITATWDHSNAHFAWFNVTISSSMSADILSPTEPTYSLNYTFTSLKAAALYTVSVVTYVNKDLNPSSAVTKSIFTKPTSPGNASAQILNNTAVFLSWEIPADSKGVKNISYSVKYVSDFWCDPGSLNLTGNNSVVIGGLKSGTKYTFNITVWAGVLESLPSTTIGFTKPEIRNVTLTMLCSSSTQLYCMNTSTTAYVLEKLENSVREKFKDNVFWNLTLRGTK